MNERNLVVMEVPPIPHYVAIGRATLQPGEQHPSRRHLGLFDLLWVVKGTLYIGEDDREWEVSSGQTLLLLPDRFHYAVKPCAEETVFYWIHFDYAGAAVQAETASSPYHSARNAWENRYSIRMRQYSTSVDLSMAERHLNQLLAYSGELRHEAFWNEQQLFMELLKLLEERFSGKKSSPIVRLAEQTEAYLRQHYQSPLTNESLAEALHYHPNYVIRCMKEIYHCTPMEYLHDYRMEQAKLLLLKTDWPIAKIAEQVGFQFAPYFSSCFKQFANVSPLKFRKQFTS
ncbi:helix-turn-helix domain-containing protein [Paenibacillus pasadenensis]|uniref:DNA-binding response regulator, AraC family n=1 Tax=Paenibacillus pasadenensis TaxID=217090 RepID=A0A2N5N8V4_9BACL|nr:AraC family transcriptional regulator [Paenibacillus pasadenensis]PLT46781.1 DNA-binding response regulator, AraC family [Paenibacillus pasadenensis]